MNKLEKLAIVFGVLFIASFAMAGGRSGGGGGGSTGTITFDDNTLYGNDDETCIWSDVNEGAFVCLQDNGDVEIGGDHTSTFNVFASKVEGTFADVDDETVVTLNENGFTVAVDDNGTTSTLVQSGSGLTYNKQITSTLATGTSPFAVSSTTVVTNFNADTLDGIDSATFGDVDGPASATDNAVCRYDLTTGKLLQDSILTVGDTGAATVTIGGTNPILVFTNATATNEFNCNGNCNFEDTVQTASNIIAGPTGFFYRNASPDLTARSVIGGAVNGPVVLTISVNTTAVGNVGSGTDTLQTYTLTAAGLTAATRGLQITASGTFANNANAKTLTCSYGAQTVLTHAATVSVAGQWNLDFFITMTGTDTQDWHTEYRGNDGAANAFSYDPERGTGTVDDGASIVISCQGAATADNDIVSEYFKVVAY
jgi:hypothetical protein